MDATVTKPEGTPAGPSGIRSLDNWFDDVWKRRTEMLPWWQAIARNLMPRRFDTGYEKRDASLRAKNDVFDRTATGALRVLVAGMLSSQSPPTRLWWDQVAPTRALKNRKAVREWLEIVTEVGHDIMHRSGYYSAIIPTYEYEAGLGTGALGIWETDDASLARAQSMPLGSYSLSCDVYGNYVGFCRRLRMTIRQVADQFGKDKLTDPEREELGRGGHESVIVRHVIRKRAGPKFGAGAESFEYEELYWRAPEDAGKNGSHPELTGRGTAEAETASGRDNFYRVGGYHEFPIIVYPWGRTGDDVFGTECPGIDALEDILQLQDMRRTSFNALEKQVDPPTQTPAGMKQIPVSFLAGTNTVLPGAAIGKIEPLHPPPNINFEHLRADMRDVRSLIQDAFFFKAFSSRLGDDRSQRPTAAEVYEEQSQAQTLLAPIQERNTRGGHDKAVGRYMAIIFRRAELDWIAGREGILPPPPQELWDVDPMTVHRSDIALAQQQGTIAARRHHVQGMLEVAQHKPDVLDTYNFDEHFKDERQLMGVPERFTVEPADVAAVRQARAEEQQAQAAADAAPGVARAARDLNESKADEDSLLAQTGAA